MNTDDMTLVQLYSRYNDVMLLHALDRRFDFDADSQAYAAYVKGNRDVLTDLIAKREQTLTTKEFVKVKIGKDVSQKERMQILRSTKGTKLAALDIYNQQPRTGEAEELRKKWATV